MFSSPHKHKLLLLMVFPEPDLAEQFYAELILFSGVAIGT